MYFLYLDDSGSVGNVNEEYFVLGGISIPEVSVRWLSNKLDNYAQAISPNDPSTIEFHAAEIFSGRNEPWKAYKNKPERINIIKGVLNTLSGAKPDLSVYACAIHKASFPNDDPVLKAYEDLSSRFNIYLENVVGKDGRGMIIIDKSSYETGLQNLAASIQRDGNRWGMQTRRIIEVPLFVDSQSSRIIQLADHIAYAVYRRYNAGDLNYYNCIENRIYQSNGIMHGLAHRQRNNPTCTCPACITRR